MNLYKYEFKKLLKSRICVLFLVIIAALNLSFGIIMSENQVHEDDYSERYSKEMDNIIYNAKMNYISIENKESENALYQLEIIKKYTAIKSIDVSGEYQGYDKALSSPLASISALLAGIIAAIMLTYQEHSSNLIFSSFQHSRIKICSAKVLMLLTVAFAGVFVFFGLNIIGTMAANGFRFFGGNLPIQCIADYIHCPYQITVLQALLLRALFASLVVFAVSMMVFLFGLLSRKSVWTLLLTVLFFATDYLLADISSQMIFSFFNNINIKSFITDSWLLKYSGSKIIFFFSQIEIFSLIIIIMLAALTFFAIIFSRYSKVIQSSKSKNNSMTGKKSFAKSLLFYESKKMFSGKVILALALLLAANVLIFNISLKTEDRDMEKIYRYFVYQMSDLSYEGQVKFLISSKINSNQLISEAKNIKIKFINGEVTLEKYNEAQQRAGAAELELKVLQVIDRQLMSIEQLNKQGVQAKLIYSTGWKHLINDNANLLLLFAIIILIVPFISFDNECGISVILAGIFGKNKSIRRKHSLKKFLFAFSASLIVMLLFNFGDFLFISSRFELNNWTSYAAGADILFYDNYLKIIDALLFKLLFSIFGIITTILIAELLTVIIKKSTFIILIMIIVESSLYLISVTTNKIIPSIASYFSFKLLYVSPLTVIVQTTVLIILMIIGLWWCHNHFHKTISVNYNGIKSCK